jgi:hypothetical protein
MIRIIFLLSITIAVLGGCSNETTLEPTTEQIVIRGYLYANEPVTDIQITGTLPLGSQDTIPPPINNASIYLLKNGKRYDLTLSPGDSGYYHYSGDDLKISTGDIFEIFVEYNGKIASAQTVVPPPPDSLSISPDTLYYSSSTNTFNFDTTRIEAKWAQVASASFYVTIENVESAPEEISSGNGFFRGAPSRFMSSPINTNSYRINRMNITYYGKHRIKVYRINQEYADLYRSRQQDSRDLNEPLTNIKNGLGIFSAFNSTIGYFYVLKE